MKNKFDVIIIGGSYAGLSAGLALGRSLRKVLIIDAGKPCNSPTPRSHNFITQDGVAPGKIAAIARLQVEKYSTVQFYKGKATEAESVSGGFTISTDNGESFDAKKLIFAAGLKDIMPRIEGFSSCWGKSILHCPYCHGYEVKQVKTGIIANGDMAFHYATLISNWTNELSVFTNGNSTLTQEQQAQLQKHSIKIFEAKVQELVHDNGQLTKIILEDASEYELSAIYSAPETKQHCELPERLGCEINDDGLVQVDPFQKTTVPGVYACGDSANMRSVAMAVSSGQIAGVVSNKELVEESFIQK